MPIAFVRRNAPIHHPRLVLRGLIQQKRMVDVFLLVIEIPFEHRIEHVKINPGIRLIAVHIDGHFRIGTAGKVEHKIVRTIDAEESVLRRNQIMSSFIRTYSYILHQWKTNHPSTAWASR